MENTKFFSNIKGNLFGGITAGIIALPLALAFGVASGLGATAGLYGAIFVGFFAALFGGTPTQVSGPTGPMTVVVAGLVLLFPDNPSTIFMAIFLAGLIQIAISFTQLANLIKYVPYPVISGFMTGIGVIIILLQLTPFFGMDYTGAPIEHIVYFVKHLDAINYQALILSILTLLIVFFTPKKINEKVPSSLIALVLCTIFSVMMKFDVATIGEIPRAFPSVKIGMIGFAELKAILPAAFSLAILGCIDSLLTSLVADSITKTKHNSRKEVFGQGLGNAISGIFGGLAGAGATMRTVVNIKAGATGNLSGVVHSLFLVSIILFFAPLASQIPMAILSAILIKVGIDIVDYKYLKVIKFSPKSDLIVMIAVFLLTVLYDLIFAVGVGIVLSALLFAVKVSKYFEVNLEDAGELSDCTLDCKNGEVTVLKVNGIFFFGSTAQLVSKVEESFDSKAIVLDCSELNSFDISAVFALEDTILKLQDKDIKILLVLKNKRLAAKILKMGLEGIIAKEDIKFSVNQAVSRANFLIQN